MPRGGSSSILCAVRAVASFFKISQLMKQEVLIRVQPGNSLIPPLSSKAAGSLPELGRFHSFLSLSDRCDQNLIKKSNVL